MDMIVLVICYLIISLITFVAICWYNSLPGVTTHAEDCDHPILTALVWPVLYFVVICMIIIFIIMMAPQSLEDYFRNRRIRHEDKKKKRLK